VGGASLADGHGDAEDSVGTQLALVLRSVQLEHDLVNLLLLHRVQAVLHQLGRDDVVHVVNSLHINLIFNNFQQSCGAGASALGEVDFGISICYIKILTAKRILRSNYKRRFSIFSALPVRKWLFCAQKSEKATK
jgi:hypothetical protein